MGRVTKVEREKIDKVIKKIKYRAYQAEIQLASLDYVRLKKTAKSIGIHASKISFSQKKKVK